MKERTRPLDILHSSPTRNGLGCQGRIGRAGSSGKSQALLGGGAASAVLMHDDAANRLRPLGNPDGVGDRQLQLIGGRSIRIYARGANLLTLSKVKDVDPESINSGVSVYPLFRTLTGGIKFNF